MADDVLQKLTAVLMLVTDHFDCPRSLIPTLELAIREIDQNRIDLEEYRRDVEALTAERDRLKAALVRLRDCDWVITLPDRMDAVREIARKALGGVRNDGGERMKRPADCPDDMPVFFCDVRPPSKRGDNATYSFDCPYCLVRHTHSAEDGHRAAHCREGSPLRDQGYWLIGRSAVGGSCLGDGE